MSHNSLIPHDTSRNGWLNLKRSDLEMPLFKQMDDFLNKFFSPDSIFNFHNGVKQKVSYPKLDIYTTETEYVVCASVPGVEADDLKVEMFKDDDGTSILCLSGKSKYTKTEDSEYTIKELRMSQFERRVVLPSDIEGDPVANLKNGMLTLTWKLANKKMSNTNVKIIPVKCLDPKE